MLFLLGGGKKGGKEKENTRTNEYWLINENEHKGQDELLNEKNKAAQTHISSQRS
jgi:hypothetical protein